MPDKSIFSQFTNLYSLTKTLRFELKPTEETKKRLPKILPLDEKRAEKYKEMKVVLDKLHNEFICDSMQLVHFDEQIIEELKKVYGLLKLKNKKRRENEAEIKILESRFENAKSKLRLSVTQSYVICAEKWKEKYSVGLRDNGFKILTEAKILEVLKQIHSNDHQKIETIKSFDKFWTYFGGFNQNRENYYSSDSKTTAVANRCIDENLIKYLDNIDSIKILPNDFPEKKKIETEFTLSFYHKYLNQNGIDEYNEIVAKLNYSINQHNQANKTKLPLFIILYKQIGSDKQSFGLFEIELGKEWSELKNLMDNINNEKINKIEKLYDRLFSNTDDFPLEQIYFHKASINSISNIWFKSWETLGSLLKENKIGNVKFTGGEYKIPKLISLDDLKILLQDYKHLEKNIDGNFESNLFRGGKNGEYISFYSDSAWTTLVNIWKKEIQDKFKKIRESTEMINTEISKPFNKNSHTSMIKDLCDAYLGLQQMLKYHIIKESVEKNNEFNNSIDDFLKESELDKYYNAFRNYLTKKPYSTDKIKLNFDNSTLLGGWDQNKESDNTSVIIKHKNMYELAILDKKMGRDIFKTTNGDNPIYVRDDSGYEKMVYKLLPGPNKMLPKVAFSKSNRDFYLNNFANSQEILKIYEEGTFKKANFVEADLTKMIDFWKHVLSTHPEWKEFNMQFKASGKYEGIDEFYSEVAKQGYKIKFVPINKQELEKLEKQGKIYRFKIHNKDWNIFAKGKKNLETIYFENMFSSENLTGEACIKLNGEAEIFRRPLSKDLKRVQKQDNNNKLIYKGKTENLVVEYERFLEDKLFFHVPITLNFSSRNSKSLNEFNKKIYETINENSKSIRLIGIDRGQKHLLYYSIIDHNGNMVGKPNSLNELLVGDNIVDFNKLLQNKQDKRNQAKLDWQQIGNIKELKAGYLSHVVHVLYKLMIEHNAFIVLEDLNTGFKKKEQSQVEKTVYQKFELALAKKLNYLVFKDSMPNDFGGVLNAYQLTPAIGVGNISIFERSKQWGSMFYVNPDYTSSTDPVSGWHKHIYVKNSEKPEKIKELFNSDTGIQIHYSTTLKCFTFSYNDPLVDNQWVLCAYKELDRFRWDSKNRKSDSINLHKELGELLQQYVTNDDAINDKIFENTEFQWGKLIYYWNILNEIRNTGNDKKDVDFIQSPVWSDKIQGFFDSRKHNEYKTRFGLDLPDNGDANGAYNIARKGLLLVNRIIESLDNKPDLFISKADWSAYIVNKRPKLSTFFASTEEQI
jgi:hypothetical protein